MRVALIWPHGFDTSYVMPIALGYLKSNIDGARHDVRIFDCALNEWTADSPDLEHTLREFQPEVVGISSWSPTYLETLKILQLAKRLLPGVVTVMGGAHATSYPEAALKSGCVDWIFRGEAELSFNVFLDKLAAGNTDYSDVLGLTYLSPLGGVKMHEMERVDDLDVIKVPDYDAMRLEEYIARGYRFNTSHERNAPIWVTRGCPYRCGFCSAPLQNGRPIRRHSVEYLTHWVKTMYHEMGIRQFNIIDDNFTFHMKFAKEFCEAMIALDLPGLHFGTPNGIRIQRTDAELLALMKRAGWENLVVAPESGSAMTLERMKKDLDPAIIPGKVEEIRQAGLKVHGFFIIGYPGDTRADLEATFELIRKCRFNFFFLNNFQPLPGTPIYDELVASGEIADGLLPKNYSSGERVYVPETLKDVNFPMLVLREYLLLALRDPSNAVYMFRLISPRMAIKKVAQNAWHAVQKVVAPQRPMSQEMFTSATS